MGILIVSSTLLLVHTPSQYGHLSLFLLFPLPRTLFPVPQLSAGVTFQMEGACAASTLVVEVAAAQGGDVPEEKLYINNPHIMTDL